MDDRDPVCGMKLEPAARAERAEFDGRRYDFCGAACRDRFLENPARFATVTAPTEVPHVHRGDTCACRVVGSR